jgi:hypothetical protein
MNRYVRLRPRQGSSQIRTDGEEEQSGGGRSTQRKRERRGGCSPAEESLLVHLVLTATRGRLWNTRNGRALRSSVYSGELKPASN